MRILWRSFAAALVIALLVPLLAQAQTDEFRASPPMKATRLPVPPKQREAWTPPASKLKTTLVAATRDLFRLGMADPRGCEYRVIQVGTGSCWSGDSGLVTTHGWILPEQDKDAERYAVCWNGLVYPLAAVGDKADVRADIEALIKAEENPDKNSPRYYMPRFLLEDERLQILRSENGHLHVCLLLRLGHADLAERLWKYHRLHDDEDDPFLNLAYFYAWCLVDRATCAHMRGDDRLSLASLRLLVSQQEGLLVFLTERGQKYLPDYFDNVPELLKDQQRRASEAQLGRPALPGEGELTRDQRRIAALIRDLENVDELQSGQPGGIDLARDPRVEALILEGGAAIEPLLDCLENDTRLTRAVHFWRDFDSSRTLVGVHEAAYTALATLLHKSFTEVVSTGESLSSGGFVARKEMVKQIRAYWKKSGLTSLPERWYQTLADDAAVADDWRQAALNIATPDNVTLTHSAMFFSTSVIERPAEPGAKPKLAGEPLRDRRSPSVTELLNKRLRTISDIKFDLQSRHERSAMEMDFLLALQEWDPPAAGPHVPQLFHQRMSQPVQARLNPGDAVRLTLMMAEQDQKTALSAYANLLLGMDERDVTQHPHWILAPLAKYPSDPHLTAAIDRLIQGPNATWKLDPHDSLLQLVTSPLIMLPSFQQKVLQVLDNKQRIGSIEVDKEGRVSYYFDDSDFPGNVPRGLPGDGPPPLDGPPRIEFPKLEVDDRPRGPLFEYRHCDRYAELLVTLGGIPWFDVRWPVPKRDAAITAIAAALRKYGSRFEPRDTLPLGDFLSSDAAMVMAFPLRGRPATADEVKQGTAIFALSDPSQSRVWESARLPLFAHWVTADEQPGAKSAEETSFAPQELPEERFYRAGIVFQAVERTGASGVERYFGFVGPGAPSQVPAAQIEFPAGEGWRALSRGLDCQIVAPPPAERIRSDGLNRYRLGDPLTFAIKLRNRRGISQGVPSEYLRAIDGGQALCHGLHVELSYSPLTRIRRQMEWQPLEGKPATHFTPPSNGRMLEPLAELDAGAVNLRHWFDCSRAGLYRLQLRFTSDNGGLADGTSHELVFMLTKPEL